MEICNHIIREDLIAGIGPLMSRRSASPEIHALYNSRQLWFWLHLKSHSVQIESDWFDIGEGNTDAEKAARTNYKAWTKLYEEAFKKVIHIMEKKTISHENNY